MLGRPQIHQEHNKYIPGRHTTTTTTYQSWSPNAPFCQEMPNEVLRNMFLFSESLLKQFSVDIIKKSSENKGGGGRPQLLQIQQYGFYWECELKCGGWRRWERRSACPGNIYTILWAGLGLVFCPEHSVLLHYYSHSPQPCLVFRTEHCHSFYLVSAIDSTKDPLQWLGHSVQCSLLNYANQPKSSISEIKQPPNTASVQAVSNLFLQIFICIQT